MMPQQYRNKSEILERIRARAWSLGKKMSPEEEEAVFRGIHDKNIAEVDAGKTDVVILDFDDPAAVPVNTPTEAYAEGLVKGVTFGHLDIFPEQGNEDPFALAAGAYGHLKGMLGGKIGAGKFKAEVPGPVGLMEKAGVPGPLAFGAYGAASPAESGRERLKNTMYNALLGVGLQVAPGALTMAGSKINPKLGYGIGKSLGTRPGRYAYDVGLFAGLGKAQDPSASWWDVLPEALGGAAAANSMMRTRPKGERGKGADNATSGMGALFKNAKYAKAVEARVRNPYKAGPGEEFVSASVVPEVAAPGGPRGFAEAPLNRPRIGGPKKLRHSRVEGEAETALYEKYLEGEISGISMVKGLAKHGLTKASRQLTDFLEGADLVGALPNRGASQTVGRARQYEQAGGGEFNNPLVKATQRKMELADQVKVKLNADLKADWQNLLERYGIKRGEQDGSQRAKFMRLFETGMDPAELARTPEGAKALKGAVEPQKIIDAAVDMRGQFDKQYKLHDTIMKAAGEAKGLKYKKGYYPDLGKIYQFRDVFKGGLPALKRAYMQKTEPVEPSSSDPSKKARVGSGREKPQTLAPKDAELDIFRIAERLSNDTAGKVADTIGLQAAKTAADGLEAVGKKRAANGIRTMGEAEYNGKRFGLAGAEIRGLQSTRTGQTIITAERLLKQQFNKAKYTLAVPFVVLRQWGSLAYVAGYGDVTPEMWAKAVANASRPGAGQKYLDSYTGWVKNIERGDVFREGGMGEILAVDTLNPPNKILTKIRKGTERPVNAMENWTGRVAVEMADIIAERAGMPKADRQAFRSEVAGRTQSFYDAMNRPEILNSPTMNLFWPAQSFSLEGMNVMKDIQARKDLSPKQKMKRQSQVAGTIFMSHLLHTFMTNYEDDGGALLAKNVGSTAGSFVPWAPSMLGIGPGPSDGSIYPANLVRDIGKAMQYAADDDMASAFGELAKNLVRGGAQANRAIGTNRYIGRGVLGEDERLHGSLLGWYTTPSGKMYLANIKGRGKRSTGAQPGGRQIRGPVGRGSVRRDTGRRQ